MEYTIFEFTTQREKYNVWCEVVERARLRRVCFERVVIAKGVEVVVQLRVVWGWSAIFVIAATTILKYIGYEVRVCVARLYTRAKIQKKRL
jgi:hypothetical protein